MKKVVFYFDPTVTKMFVEKVDEDGEKSFVLSTANNFVSRSEIVSRVIDLRDDEQIKTRLDAGYDYYKIAKFISLKVDQGILYDPESKSYKAAEYGFVIYNGGKLRLIPALSVSKDKTKAYYMVHPTKFGKLVSIKDIEEYVSANQILAGVGELKLKEQFDKIDPNEKKLTRVLVAQAKAPVNGHPEYYVPLIGFDKKAGEILSDGSIDYKEVGSIIQITKHQKILKKIDGVNPEHGYDIYGDIIPADMEEPDGYRKGENILQSGEEKDVFCSAIDGCIVVENRLVSVLPIAVINGDVNYDTGNIDFNGSVHIRGSVLAGFSVKATGDIIVEHSVEDAFLHAEGSITVKMGVVGKESVKIIAGEDLNVKYLLNAKVEAAGNIIVEDSIINCNVFSNDKVSVVAKSGKIIGGKVIALHEIKVKFAGAPNETETHLKVGRNLFIEKEVLELKKEISALKEVVAENTRQLKMHFGEGVFENPKEYIAILPDVKKMKCLTLLKELSTSNKELKDINAKCEEVQEGLKLETEPVIIVTDKIFPGVVLYIKKSVRKIDSIATNVRFYEDQEEKTIRYTAAI